MHNYGESRPDGLLFCRRAHLVILYRAWGGRSCPQSSHCYEHTLPPNLAACGGHSIRTRKVSYDPAVPTLEFDVLAICFIYIKGKGCIQGGLKFR